MQSYYVKKENRIYRFTCWADLEDFSGREKSCYGNVSLSKAIRLFLNNSRTIGKAAAKIEGWIDENDQPKIGYIKGNHNWT